MATIINNPGGGPTGSDNSAAWIIGIIVLVVIILLAIFFWPRISGNPSSTNTNVTVPTGTSGGANPANVYNTTINASTSNSTSTISGTTTLP